MSSYLPIPFDPWNVLFNCIVSGVKHIELCPVWKLLFVFIFYLIHELNTHSVPETRVCTWPYLRWGWPWGWCRAEWWNKGMLLSSEVLCSIKGSMHQNHTDRNSCRCSRCQTERVYVPVTTLRFVRTMHRLLVSSGTSEIWTRLLRLSLFRFHVLLSFWVEAQDKLTNSEFDFTPVSRLAEMQRW